MSSETAPESLRPVSAKASRAFADVVKDYVAITKPKHQAVLLTAWSTMALAGGASFGMVIFVLFTTALAVASSHVFNQLLDSEFDAKMERTKDRPLAAGRISRTGAAVYGVLLFVVSIVLAVWRINVLTALLIAAGFFVYVVIYSWWLKPRSPSSTLGGGASGAMPTLIGWAAVTGRIDWAPFLLFLFMLIWQSPHFYALSLYRRDEYAKAGFPVVSVVFGIEGTLKKIIVNTIAMIIPTLLVYWTGAVHVGFLVIAALAGAIYFGAVLRANQDGASKAAYWGRRLFLSSYLYMATIYVSAALFRA